MLFYKIPQPAPYHLQSRKLKYVNMIVALLVYRLLFKKGVD